MWCDSVLCLLLKASDFVCMFATGKSNPARTCIRMFRRASSKRGIRRRLSCHGSCVQILRSVSAADVRRRPSDAFPIQQRLTTRSTGPWARPLRNTATVAERRSAVTSGRRRHRAVAGSGRSSSHPALSLDWRIPVHSSPAGRSNRPMARVAARPAAEAAGGDTRPGDRRLRAALSRARAHGGDRPGGYVTNGDGFRSERRRPVSKSINRRRLDANAARYDAVRCGVWRPTSESAAPHSTMTAAEICADLSGGLSVRWCGPKTTAKA